MFDNQETAQKKIIKKMLHIGEIILWACALYAIFTVVKNCYLDGMSLNSFLKERMTGKDWVDFVVFNQPIVVAGHLWFLFSLLYSYAFFLLVYRIGIRTKSHLFKWVMVGLMFLHFVIGQILYIISHESIESCYYRNFMFEGIPFMFFGMAMRRKDKNEIVEISNQKIVILFLVGSVLCIGERIAIGRDFSIHVGTIFQVYSMTVYAIKNGRQIINSTVEKIGREYSLYIYVLHMVIFSVIGITASIFRISENIIYLYIQPILIVVCSIVCAALINYIQEIGEGKIDGRSKRNC